jgi:predicted cupin superfamily sugar epimerase
VDADEVWLWHAGAPLILSMGETLARDITLGPDVLGGQVPQAIVPAHHWQAARTTGDYTLVSCTVSPGFDFAGFTLAPAEFDLPRGI